jgi:hypothetical protein
MPPDIKNQVISTVSLCRITPPFSNAVVAVTPNLPVDVDVFCDNSHCFQLNKALACVNWAMLQFLLISALQAIDSKCPTMPGLLDKRRKWEIRLAAGWRRTGFFCHTDKHQPCR